MNTLYLPNKARSPVIWDLWNRRNVLQARSSYKIKHHLAWVVLVVINANSVVRSCLQSAQLVITDLSSSQIFAVNVPKALFPTSVVQKIF